MIFSATRIANATVITVAISGVAIAVAETGNAVMLLFAGLLIVAVLLAFASGHSSEEHEIIERTQNLIRALGGDIYY